MGPVERLPRSPWSLLFACALLASPNRSPAQEHCVASIRSLAGQSPRARLQQLTDSARSHQHRAVIADGVICGWDSTTLYSRVVDFRPTKVRGALHFPDLRAAALGGLADARDAGPMWSGRGTTLYGSTGVSIDAGPAHVMFAPALWWTQNQPFGVISSRDPSRNSFASPFYSGEFSLDLPLRHGADPFLTFELGESAIWGSWRGLEAGISTSTQAWGPGLRGHLFLGHDTPGMPRYFVRAAHRTTRLGVFSATGFLGTLIESRFFDSNPVNDTRKLWAWTAAYSPKPASGLTAGFTHGLMLPTWFEGPANQMTTVYVQARSPADAFRGWLEIGRMGGLPSLRRLLTVPYAGIAYLVGFEHATRFDRGSLLISAEAINLEQPRDVRGEQPRDFYSSIDLPQGWTHRGRPLGVPTGPGTQSQWLAFDWVAAGWHLGIFGERVRWNEDALLREYLAYANRHDVSLRAGMKVGASMLGYETALELSTGKRLNYLFQNGSYIPGFQTVDVAIPQVRLSVTPLGR